MVFSDQQIEIIQPNIEKYVNSVVFCNNDAKDIIQNVNLILIKKRLEFDRSKKLLNWAITICRFQIKKYLQNKKRWNRRYVNFDHQDFPIISDPFHNLVSEEKKILDKRIKAYLSEKQYNIYYYLNKGYNVKEISHKTKEPVNLVSRSKSEMIRKLKILLNEKKK
jgi:RNA polymerase sigma factor (sigma-70 family)